jgi:replicative DNA helicase
MKSNNIVDTLLEEDVVSYLLEHPHLVRDASKIIDAEVFIDPLMKASFASMVEFNIDSKAFTRYDIFRDLKSKESELNIDSSKVIKLLPKRAFDLTSVCVTLRELENKRRYNDIATQLGCAIRDGDDVATMQSIIENGLSEIVEGTKSTEIFTLGEVYDNVMDKLEANAGNVKFSGIDTGSRKLNYALGGWQEGMIVVAARPSMGKTIVGLDFAKASAKAGKRVLFLSLEMPKESLMYRYISSEAPDYKYSDIKANRITQEDVAKIRLSNARELKRLPIFFYDSDNRDINYLSMMLTTECRKNRIDIVVIDYMQLIRDNQMRGQDDFTQVSSVSNKIQKLTRKLNIPIICLSQLSRGAEGRSDKRPQLSDIRSSGNIEQDASVVIGLYRPYYYAQAEARANNLPVPDIDYTLEFILLKNRDGMVGSVIRYCDVTTNRIADEQDELFRFTAQEPAYKNSVLSKMEVDFDNDVKIAPF